MAEADSHVILDPVTLALQLFSSLALALPNM